MNLVVKVKRAFFQPAKVVKWVDRKTFIALNRFGGLVRKTAQRRMRSRKGSAPAGESPYAHGRRLLRKLLFFHYDSKKQKVTIGPVKLQETANIGVPKLMEYGGTVSYLMEKSQEIGIKDYPGHPFMNPAFTEHISKVAGFYSNI